MIETNGDLPECHDVRWKLIHHETERIANAKDPGMRQDHLKMKKPGSGRECWLVVKISLPGSEVSKCSVLFNH
jgi:hypothetical protein